MLVGNRVGVGLYILLSFLNAQLREQVNNLCRVVIPLWRGLGNIHGLVLDEKSYYAWCEDNNVEFMHVQPLFFRLVTDKVK